MTQQELQKRLNLPYSTENWKEVVQEVFPNVQLLSVPQVIPVENEKVESFIQLGNVRLNDGKSLALFELKLKSNVNILRNRVELNNLVSQYIDQDQSHGVLSIFEQGGDDYRFTFSARATEFDEEEGDFITKKTDTKRFTYVLGKNESCKTPALRLHELSTKKEQADINTIQDAFSVEKLSKEFFAEYKIHYVRMVNYLTESPSYKSAIFKGDEKAIRDFVKLSLGRLVFIQFLQKKRWIGVPANESGWDSGDPYFLKHSFQNFTAKDAFYSNFLEPLFFETLNKDGRPNQIFPLTGTKVPYLNGGLFEKGKENSHLINFPAVFFEELFEFFDRYNFTIDESDPKEQEVGIDPEMLGHIFENLLEDNKDKGAFYTPKEIVHYMCQESLLQYLKTFLEEKGKWPSSEAGQHSLEEALSNFIKKKEGAGIIDHDRELAIALRDVKICDPAIGSGAFPMGLLNEIFQAMYILYHASKDEVGDVWGMKDWTPNLVKKNIIQNSIYGVDIEKGAVDIARLRFWLSLIVDEPEPEALPNLEYKIVAGNSLISKLGDTVIDIDWNLNDTSHGLFGADLFQRKAEILKKISKEQKDFFNPKSNKKMLSADIRNLKIDLLINQLELMVSTQGIHTQPPGSGKRIAEQTAIYLNTIGWKDSIKKLQQLKNQPDKQLVFFDWKLDFPEVLNEIVNPTPGFDIVIGNPPYVRQERLGSDYKKSLKNRFPIISNGTADLYVYFYGLGLELLKDGAVLNYITLNKFLKTKYGLELRNLLAEEFDVDIIIDFFELPVFEASTDSCITKILATKEEKETKYFPVKTLIDLNLFKLTSGEFQKVIKDETEWKFIDGKSGFLIKKIYSNTLSLKEFTNNKIFRGITTGLNEAFVLEDDVAEKLLNSESNKLVQLYAKSTDIRKWELLNENKYFLATGYNLDLKNKFPTAYNYLLRFEEQLRKRQDKGVNWWNLRACKYYEDFSKSKLIYMHTAKKHEFYFDQQGRYINNSCYMIITESHFLLCFLNSKLFEWFKKIKFVAYGDAGESGRAKLDYNKMVTVPIKKISQSVENLFFKKVEDIRLRKSKNIESTILEEKLDILIYRLYNLNYEEVKVIDPEFNLSEEEYNAISID